MTKVAESIACTVPEAGMMLRVSRSTVYRLIAQGELPSFRIGARRLIPREAITALVMRSEKRERVR